MEKQTAIQAIQVYLDERTNLYDKIMHFITKYDSSSDEYRQIISLMEELEIPENKSEFSLILSMLLHLSHDHCRAPGFLNKICQLILYFKRTFANEEIATFFADSKPIKLFLLQSDPSFSSNFQSKSEFYYDFENLKPARKSDEEIDMEYFLWPENCPKYDPLYIDAINDKNFERNRQIGENNSEICSLIRNDSITEFVSYVDKMNYLVSSQVYYSLLETNKFLIKNKPNLLEYAAFFGSTKIFKYLLMYKDVLPTPSLWMYAIHSNNPKMIHLLEDLKIEPENNDYVQCLIEAIKCHHNEIALYIRNNKVDKINDAQFFRYALEYRNFKLLSVEVIDNFYSLFDILIADGYTDIVKILVFSKVIAIQRAEIESIFI